MKKIRPHIRPFILEIGIPIWAVYSSKDSPEPIFLAGHWKVFREYWRQIVEKS